VPVINKKLLIVEDNPLIVAAFERAGERLSMLTDVATDGWEAIELLRDSSYRAIVIDTDLPRHSGYGVLSYLREEKGDHLRNVILMTSSDTGAVRDRVREELQVIAKTEAVDALADAVTTACCADE
jgi:DNA-binding response OmpR family regulator